MARAYDGFLFLKTRSGGPPAKTVYNLKSGTYYDGSVLRLSATSGSAIVIADGATGILGVSSSYVSTADSLTTPISVYNADKDNVFKVRMAGGTVPRGVMHNFCDIVVSTTFNHRIEGTAGAAVSQTRIIGYEDFKQDNQTVVTGKVSATFVQYHVVFTSNTLFDEGLVTN